MHPITAFVIALSLMPSAADRSDAWITQRVREIRESDNEDWRKIPWAESLVESAKQAKSEKRLMFLFSHDGNIETGRC